MMNADEQQPFNLDVTYSPSDIENLVKEMQLENSKLVKEIQAIDQDILDVEEKIKGSEDQTVRYKAECAISQQKRALLESELQTYQGIREQAIQSCATLTKTKEAAQKAMEDEQREFQLKKEERDQRLASLRARAAKNDKDWLAVAWVPAYIAQMERHCALKSELAVAQAELEVMQVQNADLEKEAMNDMDTTKFCMALAEVCVKNYACEKRINDVLAVNNGHCQKIAVIQAKISASAASTLSQQKPGEETDDVGQTTIGDGQTVLLPSDEANVLGTSSEQNEIPASPREDVGVANRSGSIARRRLDDSGMQTQPQRCVKETSPLVHGMVAEATPMLQGARPQMSHSPIAITPTMRPPTVPGFSTPGFRRPLSPTPSARFTTPVMCGASHTGVQQTVVTSLGVAPSSPASMFVQNEVQMIDTDDANGGNNTIIEPMLRLSEGALQQEDQLEGLPVAGTSALAADFDSGFFGFGGGEEDDGTGESGSFTMFGSSSLDTTGVDEGMPPSSAGGGFSFGFRGTATASNKGKTTKGTFGGFGF